MRKRQKNSPINCGTEGVLAFRMFDSAVSTTSAPERTPAPMDGHCLDYGVVVPVVRTCWYPTDIA